MTDLYELFTKKAGIEKRALNAAQLINMAQNFARRGKLDRFDTLLGKRSKALNNVEGSRRAIQRDLTDRAYQEYDLLGTTTGPAFRKHESAYYRQPSGALGGIAKYVGSGTFNPDVLYAPNPVRGATLDAIVDTVRNLRKHYPGELERINNPAIRKAEADKWIQEDRALL